MRRLLVILAALAIGFLLGVDSREPEIVELRHTAEHDGIEIEALGEEVKQCRKPTALTQEPHDG